MDSKGRIIARPSIFDSAPARINKRYVRFTCQLSSVQQFEFTDGIRYAVLQECTKGVICYIEMFKRISLKEFNCIVNANDAKPLVHVGRRNCLTCLFDEAREVIEFGTPSLRGGVRQVCKL